MLEDVFSDLRKTLELDGDDQPEPVARMGPLKSPKLTLADQNAWLASMYVSTNRLQFGFPYRFELPLKRKRAYISRAQSVFGCPSIFRELGRSYFPRFFFRR